MNKKQNILDFYNNWNIDNLPKYIISLMNFEEKLITKLITNSQNFKKITNKNNTLILDCGCGYGSFYHITKKYNTIYYDFSFNLLKKFENIHNLKTNKICGIIPTTNNKDKNNKNKYLPFKDNSFNIILCINVLEHIENYKYALNEFNRILKKEGILIIVVVNKNSYINEDIFNDFVVYHKPLNISNFKTENFKIVNYKSFYFVSPIFKIFPVVLLDNVILPIFYKIDSKLNKLLKNKGQFLYIEMVKK